MTRVCKKTPGFFVGGLLRGSKRSIAVLDFGGKVGDCASCVAACSDESFVGLQLILNLVFLPQLDIACCLCFYQIHPVLLLHFSTRLYRTANPSLAGIIFD